MQHLTDGMRAATAAPGTGPTSRASTPLDRLIHQVERVAPKLSRASDLLLVGATAILTIVDLAVLLTDQVVDAGRMPMSVAFAVPCLGVMATIAIAVRRRHLARALVALAGISLLVTILSWTVGASHAPSFAALFALALLTTAVLRREPGRAAVLLTGLAALAVAGEALRPLVSAAAYLLILCEGALGVAIGIGVYLRFTDWWRVAAVKAARTDERLEIARELHDLVGHHLTGMVVRAQAARHVAERQPTAATVALARIEESGAQAMVAMRRMVGVLRDDAPTAPRETWDDVDQLVASAAAQGEPVRVAIAADVRATTADLVPSVHRIIAESLTNVRRHARGVTEVEIAVFRVEDRLVMTVHDNGLAATYSGHGTFGIVGMRERAAFLGGSLFAGPAPGGGWLVRAELPMELAR